MRRLAQSISRSPRSRSNVRRASGAHRLGLLGIAAVVGLGLAWAAQAEIYRYVDENGRVHFTQDLSRVPAAQRKAVEEAAQAPRKRDPIQTYQSGSTSGTSRALRRAANRPSSGGGAGDVHKIRVQKAGNSLRVQVRLNDRVTAPFIIDTGASHVVVPQSVIDQLDIDLEGARTARYSTANGTITAQLTVLDAVELGGARVEKVPAAVSTSMRTGLLGLSFFNRFEYNVDPARGIVTLKRNNLEEEGLIRGGRSEADWRSQYAQLRQRMARLEERRERVPRSRSRTHDEIDRQEEELEREYRQLEAEADRARVPVKWRE